MRSSHDDYSHHILAEIEAGQFVSQRRFSTDFAIALGLTNLLVRRLVRKGWIRVIQVNPNRVSYFLTPAGMIEKARLSRTYLQNSLKFYADARNRLKQRFGVLSRDWDRGLPKRIVFFGTGELAEIGYVCLQETDFELVGAIDAGVGRSRFFHLPTSKPADLAGTSLGGVPFGGLVVMSFTDAPETRAALAAGRVPDSVVVWL